MQRQAREAAQCSRGIVAPLWVHSVLARQFSLFLMNIWQATPIILTVSVCSKLVCYFAMGPALLATSERDCDETEATDQRVGGRHRLRSKCKPRGYWAQGQAEVEAPSQRGGRLRKTTQRKTSVVNSCRQAARSQSATATTSSQKASCAGASRASCWPGQRSGRGHLQRQDSGCHTSSGRKVGTARHPDGISDQGPADQTPLPACDSSASPARSSSRISRHLSNRIAEHLAAGRRRGRSPGHHPVAAPGTRSPKHARPVCKSDDRGRKAERIDCRTRSANKGNTRKPQTPQRKKCDPRAKSLPKDSKAKKARSMGMGSRSTASAAFQPRQKRMRRARGGRKGAATGLRQAVKRSAIKSLGRFAVSTRNNRASHMRVCSPEFGEFLEFRSFSFPGHVVLGNSKSQI